MQNSPIYLIPFDFTPVSESAMRLGLDLAIANNGSVMLLHVVKKHSDKRTVTPSLNPLKKNNLK